MSTADQFVAQAAKYIGVSGTDNIFNTWYWGKHVHDPNTYPWCAAFQSYVAIHDLGMKVKASASAAGVANQGKRVLDESTVRKGDWVVFNWDGRTDTGWCDHIGVVEWFDPKTGYFGTIEGNCNDVVTRVTRYNHASYFTAFFRPPYDAKQAAPTASAKPSQPRYCAKVLSGGKGEWLPEMVGRKSTDGSPDTFAGETGLPIVGLAVKGVGRYRVKTKAHGWLEYVDGYDLNDPENGYAGWKDSPVTAVHIPSTSFKVQVRHRGVKGFAPAVQGKACGDGKTPIDAVRIVRA